MMLNRKIAIGLSVASLLAASSIVIADTTLNNGTAIESKVVQIGPGGKVLLRGTVDSVTSNSLVVKSWGGNWIINITSDTEIMPKVNSGVTDLANFQKGDFVGVQGVVDTNASWTINAKLVRDWTYRKTLKSEEKQNKETVREMMKAAKPSNYEGKLSNLDSTNKTFTIAPGNGNMTYLVSLTTDAKILMRNWLSLNFGQVQNGDEVRVWGTASGTAITASIFRDLSIPRTQ